MAAFLRQRGFHAEILPMRFLDWVAPLRAQGFSFYLDRMADRVHAMHTVHGKVALVGHSAGGWIARIALGRVPYQKRSYALAPKVHTLLTLGSPHASIEQDLTSSLRWTNHYYPTGDCYEGTRVVCAGGRVLLGPRDGRLRRCMVFESYLAGCGDRNVEGDGVTPLCIALLPGSRHVVLDGVWHMALRRGEGLWYGDPEVLLQLEEWLQPPE